MRIYEVGPRDGIQNSSIPISTSEKVFMIESLYSAGLTDMEITSFVHPKLVPQMSDAKEVFAQTKHLGNLDVLIPNQKGFDNAKKIGASNFNIFFSPSKEFNKRNLNRSLDEKFMELDSMLVDTDRSNVRAYISCAFGCPFEGKPSENSLRNAMLKADYLADTIVLCDTVGMAHPTQILQTLDFTRGLDAEIALHLHENKKRTGDIFSNVQAAVDWGIEIFDSSINGLGGCPFIPNSGGNLSTNRLIHWAHNNGHDTGIDLDDLREITDWLQQKHS